MKVIVYLQRMCPVSTLNFVHSRILQPSLNSDSCSCFGLRSRFRELASPNVASNFEARWTKASRKCHERIWFNESSQISFSAFMQHLCRLSLITCSMKFDLHILMSQKWKNIFAFLLLSKKLFEIFSAKELHGYYHLHLVLLDYLATWISQAWKDYWPLCNCYVFMLPNHMTSYIFLITSKTIDIKIFINGA